MNCFDFEQDEEGPGYYVGAILALSLFAAIVCAYVITATRFGL
ncbi:MAG: hypothetical protein PHC39_04840 [Proteiniphilum sp.]|nr:hypothetical protein [Proteiniphilum sp.]